MRYLFGDSTESSLEINYLAFLRDAIEFGVAVLQADAGVADARDRRAARERVADEDASAVEELGRSLRAAIEPHAAGDAPVNRCAASVLRTTEEAVAREVGRVRSQLTDAVLRLEEEVQHLREQAVAALGNLLAAHDLPGAVETLTVTWTGSAYQARLRQAAGFGVDVTLALEVPSGSLLASDVRVERVAEGVEVHVPEAAGWLKKEIKRVPHKLGRHHVTRIEMTGGALLIEVRASHDEGAAGFDLRVEDGGEVAVARSGHRADADDGFATDERDLGGLRGLAEKLGEEARALRDRRGALIEARLDGTALATHANPRLVVERLVDAMAPVVTEIARRSQSPRELVLKRLLSGDRREEIFLARAELIEKLAPLAPEMRELFAPLGLVEPAADAVAAAAEPPPPAPGTVDASDAIESEEVVEDEVVEDEVVIEMSAGPPDELEPADDDPPPVAEPSSPFSGQVAAPDPPAEPPPAPSPAAVDDPPPEPPALEIEAELPPVRVRPATLPPLPSIRAPRSARKTEPPPPPRRPGPVTNQSPAATAAAVDAALRDLDDGEPTQVVTTAPRPDRPPTD